MNTPQLLAALAALLFLVEAVVPRKGIPVSFGWLGAMVLAFALFVQWDGAGAVG